MDKIDHKLLVELDKDPTAPTSRVAKKLRISQQVADYRIKRLMDNGTIQKFGTVIDLYRLGLQQYRVLLQFHEVGDIKRSEIFMHLKKHPQVYWAARVGGRYDMLLVIEVLDYPAFDSFMDSLYQAFPKCFRDYTANYVLTHELYRHKHWDDKNLSTILRYGTGVDVEDLDDLDWNILLTIKGDCRVPALQMAQRFDTTYKTVQNRIKRLQKKGVILGQRLFITDESTQRFCVLFSYAHYSKQEEKKLFGAFAQHPKISQALHMFGFWPVFLHVRCKDLDELQSVILSLREKHPLIADHEIIPLFEDIQINLLPVKR